AGAVFFTMHEPMRNIAAAAVMWALAELLVGRMRLVLPGILLTLFFAWFVFFAPPWEWGRTFYPSAETIWILNQRPVTALIKTLVVAAATLIFYARFRLPFALLPTAGALVLAAVLVAGLLLPRFAETARAAVLLACGLAVFVSAMAFDVSDRERVTRRADCAFWLHLLAAPLIVHSLIRLMTPYALREMTGVTAATIVAIVLVLTVVAVVIDRRALLVSTLTYLGAVILYGLRESTADRFAPFYAPLLVLGAMVLIIGVGWLPLRRLLVRLLPGRVAAHLPPVALAA